MFITATALPMLVALTAVGVADGTMTTAAQASVIGAGVLSVLLFPLVAVGLQRRKFAVTGGGPGLPDRPTEPRAQG